jgi:hypothetical protein
MRFLSDIRAKAGLVVDGVVTLNSVANATTDTDKFLTIESGVVKYRTGSQLLSDIGAQPLLTNPVTGVGTVGQVAFFSAESTIAGDNNLYWDNATKRLGVGTTSLYTNLTVGSGTGAKYVAIVDTADSTYNIAYIGHSGTKLHIGFSNSNTSISERNAISIDSSTLYVGVGVSAPVNRFQIGSMGSTGFSGNTFAFGNGTAATAFFQANSSTQMYLSTYLAIMPSGSGTGNVVIGGLTSNNYRLEVVGTMKVTNTVTFDNIAGAIVDTDRFLVSDNGVIKYRTGAQLLADIGGLGTAVFQSDYDFNITGNRDSSNKVFTTSANFVAGTTHVYVNGIRLTPGASYDYTETAANQITFTNAPDLGDLLIIDYIKS